MASFDLYQTVTDKIVQSIEAGVLPWVKPWSINGSDYNLKTKRPYKGINTILLAMAGFNSPVWATWNQWIDAGYRIKEDQAKKSTMIVYASRVEKKELKDGKEVDKSFFMMKYFRVYNAEQIEGYEPETTQNPVFNPIEKCETVLNPWLEYITFTDTGRAFYSPAHDAINMPKKEHFKNAQGFYSTAFHELAHLTGHETRLNRLDKVSKFGTESYAFEELIAELASAFINHACGLDSIQNHDSYIASWLKVLRNDKTAIFKASSMAQKAAELILGENNEPEVIAE